MSEQATVSQSDLEKGAQLLQEITGQMKTASTTITTLMERINSVELTTKKGLSLLELKNQAFLSYLLNLVYTFMLKLSGKSLQNQPVIDRLIELRLVLERLRPLEDKVKYQVDKYLTMDESEASSKPLKGATEEDFSDSDNEAEARPANPGSSEQAGVGEYQVPKISQAHYPGSDEDSDKEAKRARRRVLNSSMLRDALHEYTDDPDVIYNTDMLQKKAIKKQKEIERYEEEHMVRLTLSRKDKAQLHQVNTLGTMGSEILGFSRMDALDPSASVAPRAKKKKLSLKKKTKGKGKKKFKRKHH